MAGRGLRILLQSTTGTRSLGTASAVASETPEPVMPAFDYEPPTYNGISKEDVLKVRSAHVNPAVHCQTFYKNPPLFVAGKKQYLFDDEGNRYLDLFGGICTVSAGHAHDKVNAAISDQMSRVSHTANVFLHPKLSEYTEAIVKKLPEDSNLKVVYLCNSGSEANDLAILMARAYTKHLHIVGFRKAYHGASAATYPLTAMPLYRHAVSPISNISQTMSPDVLRGHWGGSHCRDGIGQTLRSCDCPPEYCMAADKYAAEYHDHLQTLCPPGQGLAGFFGEGMGGLTAALQPPKGFYKKMYEITKIFGGVNIMDEVQTAWGRLGSHYWGFEYHGVKPDIITAAKSIGNGFPLAMCVTTPEIADAFAKSALHFNTFGGNAIACSAGLATLQAIDEDGLMENSRVVGDHFIKECCRLREKHDIIGDVRGKGLFLATEFVESQDTMKPLPGYHISALQERIKEHGIIVGTGGFHSNCFRIQPPMCTTIEDADFTIAVFDKVFSEYKEGKMNDLLDAHKPK